MLGARKGGGFAKALAEMKSSCAIYALGPDLAARGVTKDDLAEGIDSSIMPVSSTSRPPNARLRLALIFNQRTWSK